MTKISKKAQFLLFNLNHQTHPDVEYRAWVEDPNKDTTAATEELMVAKLIQNINGVCSPTQAGTRYFNQNSSSGDITELIRQIRQAIPRNPKFGVIVQGLTDTALMGLVYECLGEIGRRGDPEVPTAVDYWQGKIDALNSVLKDANPDTLWQHHQKQMEAFGSVVPKKATKKK